MTVSPPAAKALEAKFQQIWGYSRFRPPQGEIVQALLAGQDLLVVMPTGGGKSICFQLPALLQTGVTLVVSPLVALMENQVQELCDRSLPAALLHSELSRTDRRQTLQALSQNRLRLLYLSPETLLSPAVWQQLCQPQVKINGLVLDEAHCLTQWGDSFRPAYRRLGAVRPALLKAKPAGTKIAIAAFTATADPHTQQTLLQVLQLQQPRVIRLNPYRANLHLRMQTVWTPRGRRQALLKFLQNHPNQPGLVYARTRRDTENLAQVLSRQGYSVQAYHAGLAPPPRRQIESDWLSGRCQFVVCTSAFGMGINKPDCRWVVHFQLPSLLAEYVQEVGRSGRDGAPAQALSLVSEPTGLLDPADQQRWRFFAQKAQQQARQAQQLARQLPRQGTLATVRQQHPQAEQALALLHRSGQLSWLDPFTYRLQPAIATKSQPTPSATAVMQKYLRSRQCRWKSLLEQFGFRREAEEMRCGKCDRCTAKP
ncbi:ATP-dependent DNA helicase RecQ [Romeria aff. gracilis LEGE 07310]|uniref:DNA 3'-5' helicase n=1 Tax=Vasconcelosia minhoensis LEGE 07310 TaxID=915328 RepID=A0A8J7AHY7_9CYAN|nr:RecQ family ATP-dependent DNA helicase [Romeria gracilis]MBE9075765.1 ATP-dependent DNA helicase RecQ [Romeria aff. gracilis LEGE 07310]